MSRYEVFGPFPMDKKGRIVDKHSRNEFWKNVNQRHPGLPSAVGCYIFAIGATKGAKGALPWYVGKTEKNNFEGETWTPSKLNHYYEALNYKKKGKAHLFLIARRTKGGRFAKPRKAGIADIRALENFLIGSCLLRNSRLLNVKQAKHLRGIVVPGYMNERPGARTVPARRLARLLGTYSKA